jgi:hypothetical protein
MSRPSLSNKSLRNFVSSTHRGRRRVSFATETYLPRLLSGMGIYGVDLFRLPNFGTCLVGLVYWLSQPWVHPGPSNIEHCRITLEGLLTISGFTITMHSVFSPIGAYFGTPSSAQNRLRGIVVGRPSLKTGSMDHIDFTGSPSLYPFFGRSCSLGSISKFNKIRLETYRCFSIRCWRKVIRFNSR